MLIKEFIDRTGFTPTDDYYHTEIEPEYEHSKLEKDDWCREWKKNGGIQSLKALLTRTLRSSPSTISGSRNWSRKQQLTMAWLTS